MQTLKEKAIREIHPKKGSELGYTCMAIYLKEPLVSIDNLMVIIGSERAVDIMVRDNRTIHCLVPHGKGADLDVAIFDGDHELARMERAFSY